MVMPDGDYDKLFEDNATDFKDRIIAYIKDNFADALGDDMEILNLPDGLDIIQEKVLMKLREYQKFQESGVT